LARRKIGKITQKELQMLKEHGTKTLQCKCGRSVEVDIGAEEATCWKCVTKMAPPSAHLLQSPEERQKERDEQKKYPKGWRLFKYFVLPDGKVYERGQEKPELFGTMQPTDVDTIRKERKANKKTTREKNIEEQNEIEKLAKKHERAKKEKEKAARKKEKHIEKLSGEQNAV